MSGNIINLVSDYEKETSSALRMGKYPDSHLPSLDNDSPKPKIIPLSDDYEFERVSRNSLEE